MISKIDILKMAKHVFRRAQGTHDRRLMHSRREWGVIVLVTLLLVAAGVGASIWRYLTYDQTQTTVEHSPEAERTYQAEMVDHALATYAARRQQFEEQLLASPPKTDAAATSTDVTGTTSTPSTSDDVATTTMPAGEEPAGAEFNSAPPAGGVEGERDTQKLLTI